VAQSSNTTNTVSNTNESAVPNAATPEKFGTLLGHAPGNVPIYSSHYPSVDSNEHPDRKSFRSELDGVYMGYKWQCVEFARRWLYVNHGYVFDDVAMAYDIFRLHSVTRLADQQLLPLHSFRNGALRPPEPGCMLIWEEGGEFEVTGHVAIVTEVLEQHVRFAEQNIGHRLLPEGRNWSRELAMNRTDEGGYFISAPFAESHVLGWMVQTEDAAHAELPVAKDPALYNLNTRLAQQKEQHLSDWLDVNDPAEAAFVKAMHGHRLSEAESVLEHYRYFRLSETADAELRRATNELHLMFLHATQAVLQDDSLLARFNIPKALWPRLKTSWANRRNQMVTGRFDFCVTDNGIKVYEYNADSASCHLEAGRIQGKWAPHFGVREGDDAGAELFDALIHAWSTVDVVGMLHIMQDRVSEETYHAEFMKAAAEAAGHPCKIIMGLDGLSWNEQGEVLDPNGVPIRFVWKTWAWETALDQLREECEDDDAKPFLRAAVDTSKPPRLMDVLLRSEVKAFEPFWTLIPSNKAILPILWQIFPNHPYLLNSRYELNGEMAQRGYVTKPIAGRCGLNITLYDKNDRVLKETTGQFDHQDNIYQELRKLPTIDGYRTQVCTFSVLGKYAGSCVRIDKSLVITMNSDLLPLRVVADEEL